MKDFTHEATHRQVNEIAIKLKSHLSALRHLREVFSAVESIDKRIVSPSINPTTFHPVSKAQLKLRNNALKCLVRERARENEHIRDECIDLENKIAERRLNARIAKVRSDVLQEQKKKTEKALEHTRDFSSKVKSFSLRNIRLRFLNSLVKDVFCLSSCDQDGSSSCTQYQLDSQIGMVKLDESQSRQLTEAMHTYYLGHGEWMGRTSHDSAHYSCRVVKCQLSQEENYNALVRYLNISNHSDMPGSGDAVGGQTFASSQIVGLDRSVVNTAFEQAAALGYLTQLLQTAAIITDQPLPCRICYTVFTRFKLSPRALYEAICKLDINIMHFCFAQGVEPTKLRPDHNIRNLMHCFADSNTHLAESNLSYTIHRGMLSAVEDFFAKYDSLNQMNYFGEEDDAHICNGDWEELPENVDLTAEQILAIENSIATSDQQKTPALISSAFSSFGSWFGSMSNKK